MRYVIIGNSAAGVFAAEAIRKLDQAGRIDIISDEDYPAYARCLTSYYLTGQMADEQTYIRPADFYAQNNLNLHPGQKVIQVNPEQRTLTTAVGDIFNYDKLLIASGASPAIPDIPGVHTSGVYGLRTLNDAKGIRSFAGPGQHGVVVGGGLVSLKAAYALLKAGLKVTCVISSGQILSQMLDQEAASLVAETLISRGLQVKYQNDVTAILSREDDPKGSVVGGVRLKNGEELPADVVIIGKGVTPNTNFLERSKIAIDHGILVDQFMAASVPDIYAAGDVAQGLDVISGQRKINAIWPNAAEQGRVAGSNMAGSTTTYDGSIGMNSADFFGLSTIAAGLTKVEEGQGYQVVKLYPGQNLYRKLVFKDDNLVGFIMVGQTAKAGLLTALIKERLPLGQMKQELMRGSFRQRMLC